MVTVCSAFFNIKKRILATPCIYVFKIVLRESSDYLLKIKRLIFCLQKFSVNLLHIFVVYMQHTKHLIATVSAHEEISKCLDTHAIFKIVFNFIFFKLYLIVF